LLLGVAGILFFTEIKKAVWLKKGDQCMDTSNTNSCTALADFIATGSVSARQPFESVKLLPVYGYKSFYNKGIHPITSFS
jgi:hypothetical protein